MKKKMLLIVVVLAFITIMTLALSIQRIVDAQDCRIVRITAGVGERLDEIALEPRTMRVDEGTCVIWINLSRSPDVEIKFRDGGKCIEATDAPTGFNPELLSGCYVTGMIHMGATSSLRFVEKGTFEYMVETAQETIKTTGEIIVE